MHAQLRPKIAALAALGHELYNKDFLLTWEASEPTLRAILLTAEILEDLARAGVSTRTFRSGLGVAVFRDKSTRTRYSFRAACNLLGLATEELDESTSQVSHGETVRETSAMVGFLSEVIGIRDDMFLGEGHKYMTEVSASLDESHKAGILLQRPAVINLQSDLDHPTQALADLRHLVQHFGGVEALRGRKLVMSWAYSPSYGKPLSVPQGVIGLMTRFGMDVVLAHPPGYELVDDCLTVARRFSSETGGSFSTTDSMDAAFEAADVVYPKSWAPMAVMHERTRMIRAGERAGLADLERQALAQNARFKHWECTDALMRRTRGGRALYMHCLPADVTDVSCPAGEVSQAVFESARLETYREASYKPFIIASMILNTRFPGATATLTHILDDGRPRRGHAG
ncbi:MAG: knotted carbamoyltransferase YgeW [Acidobacteria bacterium RIFCSPLOWO2_02_FULL_67_36]|nr:MAG: knotted carbamoyltransferase YgeW [Acidobacteria bacterium RIFCSPLOWO2_02_FULL_67_36]OFW25306.1 MAG: knotted carbamoyltransferase YgeW [Acidobacteria bacterium RIFCSPLOWO2_12_FULL_66_21]